MRQTPTDSAMQQRRHRPFICMLADKAGDTLGTKLDVWYLQNQIEGLPTFILFAANAKGNDAEVNLSMR